MKKVGVFFGPEGGSTENVAKKVVKALGENNAELVSVNEATNVDIERYDNIIFGLSTIGKDTWNADTASKDWDKFMPQLMKAKFYGKTVAIFGLGDHITYDLHFCDAIGVLANRLRDLDVNLVGSVSVKGYEFRESKAVEGNMFLGLAIDEDYESDLTDKRVQNWVDQLKKDFQ